MKADPHTPRLAELKPREYHARRNEARIRHREGLRTRTLAQAREAILRLAPRHPAIESVYLFGSILRRAAFREYSDVDVAIECDDLKEESRFWRELEEALERDVDVRPWRGRIADTVESMGELVYERKMAATRT